MTAAAMALSSRVRADDAVDGKIVTVSGPIAPEELGVTLPHEHVLVDFVGADRVSRQRYQSDEALAVILPHVKRVRELGCRTLVECTPAYLGRDPQLLKRLSEATGLRLITNTGYYGAREGKFLPQHAFTENADQISKRWLAEWRSGIEEAGVRPGFIKIGVDAGPLTEVNRKIVQAAARTHLHSGLTIAGHTGDGPAALEQLDLLQAEGVGGGAWIWVHAQNERDGTIHRRAAERGAWISLDGVSPDTIERHVQMAGQLRQSGHLDRVLVSHDAGWYAVGEPGGGTYRGYETLFTEFLPALRKAGFSAAEIEQLTVANPARAFTIGVRR
jgi:phosphotriesterase-related protein